MIRLVVAALLFVAALSLSLFAAPQAGSKKAKANDGVVENWGRPNGYAPGKVTGYWLWYDDGVWHLRTTGGGKGAHRFNGLIEVAGGKLTGLKGQKGEFKGPNADRFVFNRTLTAIEFDFKTDEGADGLDFAVAPATAQLKFTLALDGDAAPKYIRIGRAGDHPAAAVFTAPGHPPDPPDAKGKKKAKK